jgi:hypothetical protein
MEGSLYNFIGNYINLPKPLDVFHPPTTTPLDPHHAEGLVDPKVRNIKLKCGYNWQKLTNFRG